MGRNKQTTMLVDGLLKSLAVGGVTLAALLAPNSLKALEKPLQNYLRSMDAKKRKQEALRLLRYSRQQGLISGNYKHGLHLTDKAHVRLQTADLDNILIPRPERWDETWRIVFYDIPEHKKTGRDALAGKMRELDFYQLQRSVWVHPFPCHDEILTIAAAYGVHSYVTIVEATSIQNQHRLENIFSDLI